MAMDRAPAIVPPSFDAVICRTGALLCGFSGADDTFPLLSPIVRFSGPAVWKDALSKFGVTVNILVPSILFFVSGAILLCALLFFWIVKARKVYQEGVPTPVILGPTGAALKQAAKKQDKLFRTSAILSFVGMAPLFTAIGEVAIDLLAKA